MLFLKKSSLYLHNVTRSITSVTSLRYHSNRNRFQLSLQLQSMKLLSPIRTPSSVHIRHSSSLLRAIYINEY